MVSNNLKVKKKRKVRKLENFKRLKEIKRTKVSASELCMEPNFVNTLSGVHDILINRLCDQQIYSRSYINDGDISKMKKFTQVRQQYFGYLQKVIKNNCAYYGSPITEDILDSLSIKLEQHALLSSFQIDVYENFMKKIISDIEKCTKERQIHNEVKKLLPDSEDKETVTKINGNSSESEKWLGTTIPNSNEFILADQSVFNSEPVDQCPPHSQYSESCSVPQDNHQPRLFSDVRTDDECNTASNNNSNFSEKGSEPLRSLLKILQLNKSMRKASSPLQNENDSADKNKDLNPIPPPPQNFINNEKTGTVSESSEVLDKCLEHIFSQNKTSDKVLEGNDIRSYLLQMLRKNTSDDRVDNVQSENGSKSSENKNETLVESEADKNLGNRLEKMRALLNIDEGRPKRIVPIKLNEQKKSIPKGNKEGERQLKRLNAWRNEKIIQLYKVSILASRLSVEKREKMQKLFVKLFGEDSDEENEFEYGSTDRFKTSCIERISAWVVKHLMPFYQKKRIIGRKMFKSLARRIAEVIIDKIQYPDERTVKYFVSKYFPPNKNYGCMLKRSRPKT